MARQALVVDASVLVKWFSTIGEANVAEAVDIMERDADGDIVSVAPLYSLFMRSIILKYKKVG